MGKAELIDSHVSVKQCKLAVEALHAHATKQEKERSENELLPGNEQHVWLQIAVRTMQPEHKLKPIRIPLKYPLVDPRTSGVCLITKDPQREYKNLLEEQNIKFISRVVGIEKLKGKFKPFEARRLLLKENAMFLADERVIPLLPRLLGSKWFEAKKQPIPVNLKRKDLKGELERAIESSYMHQNRGTCTSVKVGILSQTPTQIQTNIQTALPAIVSHIKGGWSNIQSFHIKTSKSISLPIWTCDLGNEEGGRWDGLVAGQSEERKATSGDEEPSEAGETSQPSLKRTKSVGQEARTTKGTKRQLESGSDEPKKKTKTADAVSSLSGKTPSLSKTKGRSAESIPHSSSASSLPTSTTEPSVESKLGTKKTKTPKKADAAGGEKTPSTSHPTASQSVPKEKSKSSKTSDPAREKPPSQPYPSVIKATAAPEPSRKKKSKVGESADESTSKSSSLQKSAKVSKGSLSQEDVKAKHDARPGEKKKAKVLEGRKGKSVKDALLGKKKAE
ncbi:ribosomal protein L1p/L10e family-domain-containing protein [Phlebopus sp. FC_14]|nr:ribosomal protein L1p/L10e family-domain-containing protein [Phlebopus sp. FC_14]